MAQRYDLVIVGGGPSGSAAAWQAAQTGAKVVVLDKAEFPRDKPVWRRPDRPRRQLFAENGAGRRGRQVPPRRPGHGVQPEPVGAVVPAPPRHARPRPHRRAATELDTLLLKHAESAGAQGAPGRRGHRDRSSTSAGWVTGVASRAARRCTATPSSPPTAPTRRSSGH